MHTKCVLKQYFMLAQGALELDAKDIANSIIEDIYSKYDDIVLPGLHADLSDPRMAAEGA
jgi:hypothetical protein